MNRGEMSVSQAGKMGGAKRGRQMRGENNPNAKLSPGNIATIKDCQGQLDAKELGRIYGVHPEHIRRIWRGELWNG